MNSNDNNKKGCCSVWLTWDNAVWWSKLVVAVIAVPMLGILAGSLVPGGDMGKTIAFVITCWVSVFIGMKIMQGFGPSGK